VDRIQKIKVSGDYNDELDKEIKEAKEKFVDSINDDLNMPAALAAMFDMIKEVNIAIDERNVSESNLKEVHEQMMEFDKILGLLEIKEEELPEEIQKLVEEREEKRKAGDFDFADKIRKEIEKRGYDIEDTPEGPIWKKKEL